MSLRGEDQRAAIRAVLDAFGEDALEFVFIGACTLGLYARTVGAPLRATKDVDCISTVTPWVLQERKLADMCSRGALRPDPDLQCRYRIQGTEVDVDVLSPDGLNVGAANPGAHPWKQKRNPAFVEFLRTFLQLRGTDSFAAARCFQSVFDTDGGVSGRPPTSGPGFPPTRRGPA